MNVAVIGAGYVGVTTGVVLAYLGHEVHCLDIDCGKIRSLEQGTVPFHEPLLEPLLRLARPRLHFTSSYASALPRADVIFIAVGTPASEDGSPDLSFLRTAAAGIGQYAARSPLLVVNKSTVPLGSGNLVESLIRSAITQREPAFAGIEIAVASNPEFLREGSAVYDSLYPDRIVIGSDHLPGTEKLHELYKPLLEQTFTPPSFLGRPEGLDAVPLITTDLASAELIKYAANAFLALKVSFINEVANLAERAGADIAQVAKGIGLDPRIGTRFLQAGLGWGGSCLGKDTAALLSTGREYGLDMQIVRAATEVNYRQREHLVERLLVEHKILKGRSIGILGAAFKPNTSDIRDSVGVDIARRLTARGALVTLHDPVALPMVRQQCADLAGICVDETAPLFRGADAVVLATEWNAYLDLPWEEYAGMMRTPVLFDGRNFLDRERLRAAGLRYLCIGR